jgi:hypothetical protein
VGQYNLVRCVAMYIGGTIYSSRMHSHSLMSYLLGAALGWTSRDKHEGQARPGPTCSFAPLRSCCLTHWKSADALQSSAPVESSFGFVLWAVYLIGKKPFLRSIDLTVRASASFSILCLGLPKDLKTNKNWSVFVKTNKTSLVDFIGSMKTNWLNLKLSKM